MRVRCYAKGETRVLFHQVDGPAHLELPTEQFDAEVETDYELELKPAKPRKAKKR